MRYKKIYRFVMENFINTYGLITENIKKLEEKKEQGISKDINSYLKSKNKVNRTVENIVINNILIDENISILIKWKEIIDKVFYEFINDKDESIEKILSYKLFTSYSEETICELCEVSDKKTNRIIKDFMTEIIIIALDKKLLNLKQFE